MIHLTQDNLTELATHFADIAQANANIAGDCLAHQHANSMLDDALNQKMEEANVTADLAVAFGRFSCLIRDCNTIEELIEETDKIFEEEKGKLNE